MSDGTHLCSFHNIYSRSTLKKICLFVHHLSFWKRFCGKKCSCCWFLCGFFWSSSRFTVCVLIELKLIKLTILDRYWQNSSYLWFSTYICVCIYNIIIINNTMGIYWWTFTMCWHSMYVFSFHHDLNSLRQYFIIFIW